MMFKARPKVTESLDVFCAELWSLMALFGPHAPAHEQHGDPRWFRAPLPAEPAQRSLGAAVFEADGQSRDRRVTVSQAAYQCPRANSRRSHCDARRQRDGL